MAFRPTHRSQIGVNYAYTDFRYLSYILNNGTGDTSGTFFKCVDPACSMIDLSGHEAGITPRHAVSLFGQWDIPLPDDLGHLNFYADVAYRSAVWTDAFNSDAPFLRKLTQVNGLVNANVSWMSENQRYKLSLWVKNLTKVRSVVPLVNISGAIQQLYGLGPTDSVYLTEASDPRTFGVTLTVDFK
jgi:outer membrane receptor protein involved in Fe transport